MDQKENASDSEIESTGPDDVDMLDLTSDTEENYNFNFKLVLPDAEKFELLNPNNLMEKDEFGNTFLHRAILESGTVADRNQGVISYLLTEVPHLTEEVNNEGETPLCLACKLMAYHEIISALIECSPNVVNMPDKKGKTPLYHLSGQKFYELPKKPKEANTKSCEDNGINGTINKTKRKINTISDIVKIAQLLIENGTNVNKEDNTGKSIIVHTIVSKVGYQSFPNSNKSNAMIKLLLDNGSNLCWTNLINNNNLYANAYKLLIKNAIDVDHDLINKVDDEGKTVVNHVIASPRLSARKLEIIEYLLKNGANIKNLPSDTIKLAVEQNGDYSTIELLLEYNPDYDVNTKYNNGTTLLIQYGKNVEIIDKLLQLGADPNIIAENGTTALLVAMENNCSAGIMKLLQAGADPLVINSKSEAIPTLVLQKCLESKNTEFLYDWFKLFKYILNKPELKKVPSPNILTTYCQLIKTLYVKYVNKNESGKRRILQILPIVLKANKIISMLVVKMNEVAYPALYESMLSRLIQVTASKSHYQYLEEFVHMMLDAGVTIKSTRNDCLTPLTVLMKQEFANKNGPKNNTPSNNHHDKLEPEYHLASEFISKGVNVESMIFRNSVSGEELVKELKVPDALYFAYIKNKQKCVELLLPYWWAPPLALLPLSDRVSNLDIVKIWLPLFMKYGGIPHGTQMFQRTHDFVTRLHILQQGGLFEDASMAEDFGQCWIRYSELTVSPLTLQELCKYKVRYMLADEAMRPDISLPALLKHVLPNNKEYLASHDKKSVTTTVVTTDEVF